MIEKYADIVIQSFAGYWNYLVSEIAFSAVPWYHNYFYGLIGLSLLVWGMEWIAPWRKNRRPFRKDFWLDGFYMFFNFFLFSLVGYNALSNVAVEAFNDLLSGLGIRNIVAIEIGTWPTWVQLLTMFVAADFIQWNVHRLLHRVPWLWEFHKVHHSVKEMGFASHLRFHWMETVVYKTLQYIPLAMIGFRITDFFMVHIVALLIGHLNHANLAWNYGPLRWILNNPAMHTWHHAKAAAPGHPYGTNFGLSLSIWDYLFGTAYLPHSGGDIELGFPGDESFPKTFTRQVTYPLFRDKK